MDDKVKNDLKNLSTAAIDIFSFGAASVLKEVHSTYTSIHAGLFAEKVTAFLKESSGVTDDVKEKFKLSIKKNESEFFKKLWIILDRLDDKEKATLAGKLFKSVLNDKIKVDDFLELLDIIQRMYIAHIKSLKKEYLLGTNLRTSNVHHRNQLIQNGLMPKQLENVGQSAKRLVGLTSLGEILHKHL